MMKRMGEIGESVSIGSESMPLNLRHTLLSSRKEWLQLTISGEKPRSLISWTNLGWLTLSKKPDMSKRHMPVLSPAVWVL